VGTRAGCREPAGVLPNLLAHRKAVFIVIELDIVSKDGIGLSGIARNERCIEQDAVHAREFVE